VEEARLGNRDWKRTRVVAIADGNSLPISIYVTSANHHEIKLVQPTLESVQVPQWQAHSRLKELVSDGPIISKNFGAFCESLPSLSKETAEKEKVTQWQWATGTNNAGKLSVFYYPRIVVRYIHYIPHFKYFV
jgi:hypothetical protein